VYAKTPGLNGQPDDRNRARTNAKARLHEHNATKGPPVNPKPQRPLSGNFKRDAVVTTRERAL